MNGTETILRTEHTGDLTQAIKAFGVSVADMVKSLGELIQAIVAALDMTALQNLLAWYLAYNWAKQARPKWVAIMNRTKKRRTRKKYRDRILREYKEASQ